MNEPLTLTQTAPLEVGISCENLDAQLLFYTDVLGMMLVQRVAVPAAKAAPSGLARSGYEVARLQTPWGERIKLLAPSVAPIAPASAPQGEGILSVRNTIYLTFIVSGLSAVVAALRERDVIIETDPAPMEVRPGTWLAFCRDPEGNVLEFVEYDDVTQYRPDLAASAEQLEER